MLQTSSEYSCPESLTIVGTDFSPVWSSLPVPALMRPILGLAIPYRHKLSKDCQRDTMSSRE